MSKQNRLPVARVVHGVVLLEVPFQIEPKEIFIPDGLFYSAPMLDVPVSLNTLVATQARVAEQGVLKYLEGASFEDGDGLGPPQVVRAGGKDYIVDGHHRFTAAWLQGTPTVLAEVASVPDIETLTRFPDPSIKKRLMR